MYSRNMRKGGELSEEEREIAKYGLPPKYDGNRFRRPPSDERPEEDGREPGPFPPEEADRPIPPHFPPERGRGPHRDGDGRKIERLIESLGERLGTEEILILAPILILSGSGGGECEDAGDVVLLLALLLIMG
ncbi:MAG: hypothetical protein IKG80_03550 [Clostridia bacterium]|nr:hypothetical protein [Clostridia bacterium]